MHLVCMSRERKHRLCDSSIVSFAASATPDAPPNWRVPPLGPSVGVRIYFPEFWDLHEITSDLPEGHANREWHDFEHYVRKSTVPGSMGVPYNTWWYNNTNVDNTGWHHEGTVPRADSPCQFGSRSFGGADVPFDGLPLLYTPVSAGHFIAPPDDLSQLLTRALRAVLPGIRSELSLINSVIELKDFRTFGKFVSELGDSFERITRQMPRDFLKLTPRQILRRLGESYLQYNFNIAPLLSDIQGVFNSFKLYQSQLLRMMKASEKTLTRHYTVHLAELFDSDETHPFWHGYPFETITEPGFVTVDRRFVRSEPSKFHVEVQFNASYSDLQREHALLFALLDKLGVNFNPQIIWNAIPWSFVVDWMIDVSQFLGRYKTTNTGPVINIQRCLWSITRERRISTSFDFPDGKAQGVPASFVYESAYRRQVFHPTTDSIQSSGLNLKEVSLGAALVSTRRPRHQQTKNYKYAK